MLHFSAYRTYFFQLMWVSSRVTISQSINIRLLRHDKMQANNSKQTGNTVSKKRRKIFLYKIKFCIKTTSSGWIYQSCAFSPFPATQIRVRFTLSLPDKTCQDSSRLLPAVDFYFFFTIDSTNSHRDSFFWSCPFLFSVLLFISPFLVFGSVP